jgi:hypothetical protein
MFQKTTTSIVHQYCLVVSLLMGDKISANLSSYLYKEHQFLKFHLN